MTERKRVRLVIDEDPDHIRQEILLLTDDGLITLMVDELQLTLDQIYTLINEKWVEFQSGTLEILHPNYYNSRNFR